MLFSAWGELEFHKWLLQRFSSGRPLGLGDDAAVIELGRERLAVTVDASVAGVHFRPDWMTWREIGGRAALACLSDLAAACARPLALLATLGVPDDASAEAVRQAAEGIAEAAEEFSARLIGGDTTAAPVFFLDLVAVGRQASPWSRRGARPGDVLAVTGALGGAAAAAALLYAGRAAECDRWASLRKRFVWPQPRVAEALALARAGVTVHAAMDLSDGLMLDTSRLCGASGVGAVVTADCIPIDEGVAEAADILGRNPLEFAAAGGEDYELLLALAPEDVEAAGEALAELSCPLTVIGHVGAGEGVQLVDASGKPVALPRLGYEHYGR